MCLFRFPAWPNESPHCAHMWTFSSVWMIMCLLKLPVLPKDFSHSEQVWVFTPLWVSMCLFRCDVWPNDFWHWTQLKALTLVWVTMCLFRSPLRSNDFLQCEQKLIFAPLWFCKHVASLLWWVYNTQWHVLNCKILTFPSEVHRRWNTWIWFYTFTFQCFFSTFYWMNRYILWYKKKVFLVVVSTHIVVLQGRRKLSHWSNYTTIVVSLL